MDIKKFYRKQAFDYIFFGHINCLRFNVLNGQDIEKSIDRAITNFIKYYKLEESELDTSSLKTKYLRMFQDFMDTHKE